MEPVLQLSTSPFCTGVLDLVIFGHISARKGVSLLSIFRKTGSPEERKCAVAALRYLANCPEPAVARSFRIALHELFVEDMWDLFTHNCEAVARVKAEYDEVTPGSPPPHPSPPPPPTPAPVAGTPVAPSTSIPAVTSRVREDDGDSDSPESF